MEGSPLKPARQTPASQPSTSTSSGSSSTTLRSAYVTRSKTVALETVLVAGKSKTVLKVGPAPDAAAKTKIVKKREAAPAANPEKEFETATTESSTQSIPALLDIVIDGPPSPAESLDPAIPPPSDRDEDWTRVVGRRQRRDSTLSSSSSTSSSGTPVLKTLFVSGLPQEACSPKALDTLFRKVGLIATRVSAYQSGRATVSSFDGQLREKLIAVGHQLGKPIDVSARHTAAAAATSTTSKKSPPTFSCVLAGVEPDITEEEVKEALRHSGIPFTNAWRIRSKATNRLTRFVRVVTPSKEAVDTILAKGVVMFNHAYRAEPSRAPKPQVVQCQRCFKFGHTLPACPDKKPSCGMCGGDRGTGKCQPEAERRCANCGGSHAAFSPKCPARPESAEKIEDAAPLKTADVPTSEVKATLSNPEASPLLVPFLRFTVTALLNLFPDRREQVTAVLRPLIHSFFGLQVFTSYAGNYVHVSLVK